MCMMPSQDQLASEEPSEIARRLSQLQVQLDHLTRALNAQRHGDLEPVERRLGQLAEQCADILDRWSTDNERVRQDTVARMQEIHVAIEREWTALRLVHEAPVKELREQASTLTEICAATAATALRGFERAEARLAALESDLHRRLTEWSNHIESTIHERHATGEREFASETSSSAPSGERRVNLQNQPGRSLGHDGRSAEEDQQKQQNDTSKLPPDASPVLAHRVETPEPDVDGRYARLDEAARRADRARRVSWLAVAALLLALAAAGVFLRRVQQQIDTATGRVTDAERRMAGTTTQQLAAIRDEMAMQLGEVRSAAQHARSIGDVLAAPDLVRYALIGGDATRRALGLAWWSRSRGLVFSAALLPPVPANAVYQIWILTRAAPVSAGVFVPDVQGRFTFVTDVPNVAQPMIGVSVTIEPPGGSALPTGRLVLAHSQ